MHFYASILRATIHVVAVLILIGSAVGGYQSAQAVGAVLGFVGGLVVVGVFAGTIGILFEIRDTLKAIQNGPNM